MNLKHHYQCILCLEAVINRESELRQFQVAAQGTFLLILVLENYNFFITFLKVKVFRMIVLTLNLLNSGSFSKIVSTN